MRPIHYIAMALKLYVSLGATFLPWPMVRSRNRLCIWKGSLRYRGGSCAFHASFLASALFASIVGLTLFLGFASACPPIAYRLVLFRLFRLHLHLHGTRRTRGGLFPSKSCPSCNGGGRCRRPLGTIRTRVQHRHLSGNRGARRHRSWLGR